MRVIRMSSSKTLTMVDSTLSVSPRSEPKIINPAVQPNNNTVINLTTYTTKHRNYYQRHKQTILTNKRTNYHKSKLPPKPLNLKIITTPKSPSPLISNNTTIPLTCQY